MDIAYLSKTGSLEKNETEIFGLGISLVGILCRLLRPGFHILSYLLQLSTPQLHNLYTLAGLTRVFLMRTAHEIQIKMTGLVIAKWNDGLRFYLYKKW